ncbi:MAG: sodium:proton antiporter [Planctomycetota bacterium]|nr:sodium:proton antiporter [Planctomycetota bacterium]
MPAVPVLLAAGSDVLPPLWSVAPFVLTLLGIAVLPLVAPHWWESNRNRAIFVWGIAVPTAVWWVVSYGWGNLLHEWQQYISFILLLGSLYVASGGIFLRADLRGKPGVNVAVCAIGAVLANLIGTTGASMLLIRPYLKANEHRPMKSRVVTVVFFIFTVSNMGGCLTPLGDPPLFLGFLKGVPFEWTLKLWPEWLFGVGSVLLIFLVWDALNFRKEPAGDRPQASGEEASFGIEGKRNIVLLLGVVAAVLCKGIFKWPFGPQELLMAVMAAVSMRITPTEVRRKNHYSWGPILEVAILFSGIFTVMVPALAILNVKGADLGLTSPVHYFWVTGGLSSFLDNAPTYLVFGQTAMSDTVQRMIESGIPPEVVHAQVADDGFGLLVTNAETKLAAISVGAVFMGANTYIGNGPNFMVKAIAEESGVRMPSFFGYFVRFSLPILVPLFIVVSWIFFRS